MIRKSIKYLLYISIGVLAFSVVYTLNHTKTLGFTTTDLIFGKEKSHNEEGRFYYWWIDDVMSTESYKDSTDFQKDLFTLHKKWCIDEPRPSVKSDLVMSGNP